MATTTDRAGQAPQLQLPAPGLWDIDPVHSEIEFLVRHLMISKVRGRFREFSGTLTIDEVLDRSSVEVTIKATSIDTGDSQRDAHLRSAEFLDVERHPDIRFRSMTVRPTGPTCGQIVGILTVKGTTRPVTLEVEFSGTAVDPWGNDRAGFVGTMKVNREDFGITWNQALESGGFLLGKQIELDLDVEAVHRKDDH